MDGQEPIKINERLREKICFGEDPAIYIRTHELSKNEIKLFRSMSPLDQRTLGDYLYRNELIPDNVLTYATKGYVTRSSRGKVTRGYKFSWLEIHMLGVERDQDIDTIAEMFTNDLREVSKRNLKGIKVEANLSGGETFLPDLSIYLTPEKKTHISFLRAYCANIQDGTKILHKRWREQNE